MFFLFNKEAKASERGENERKDYVPPFTHESLWITELADGEEAVRELLAKPGDIGELAFHNKSYRL